MMKRLIISILPFLFIGCLNEQHKQQEKIFSNYPQLYLKKIYFNQDGFHLDTLIKTTESIKSGNYKIVTLIDGTCPTCIKKVNEMDCVFKKNISSYKIDNIVIAIGGDFEYLKNSFKETNYITTVLFDKFGNFLEVNNILSFGYITYIVNSNNEIILVGNPFTDTKILRLL